MPQAADRTLIGSDGDRRWCREARAKNNSKSARKAFAKVAAEKSKQENRAIASTNAKEEFRRGKDAEKAKAPPLTARPESMGGATVSMKGCMT